MNLGRRPLLVAGVTALGLAGLPFAGPSPRTPAAASADSSERVRALHILNRLTFGPRPGEVDRVAARGVERFIEQQLHPETIKDEKVARRLKALEIMHLSRQDLARIFLDQQRERRQRQQAGPDTLRPSGAPALPAPMLGARRLAGQFQQAAVLRATLSERQLHEVMVDFWTNHFNVFLGKGADRFLLPDYIEHTIRPNAMGRFEDLLRATAHSPAMLFYLDNVQSVAPGSRPPQLARLEQAQRAARRPGMMGRRPGLGFPRRLPDPEQLDSMRARIERRLPQGINENYSRELMELHTLGVAGGYTQQDVINVARILTGWSMTPPQQGARFVFNEWAHDRGDKVVLGHRFPAGRGQDEGDELLGLLANHPSTMRHVSTKLCARFLADDPPDGCVDAAVHAWERTGGSIREVLRAIFRAPEFWAPEYRGAKIKTPLEFVVSAVRAVGGEPDSTLALAQLVGRLGQPLYLDQPPTGYPETQESWVNSGALLERLNVAMGIAAGRAPGVRAAGSPVPATDDPAALAEAVNRLVLNGTGTPNTLRVIRRQTAGLPPQPARILALGLALGSPEFQRQ